MMGDEKDKKFVNECKAVGGEPKGDYCVVPKARLKDLLHKIEST